MDEQIHYAYNTWRVGPFRLPEGTVERDIHRKTVKLLKEKEILLLVGLRQTGKSTLVFQRIHTLLYQEKISPGKIFYFNLDDLSLRQE